jgi:protein tyrosine/serine phosphatase
MDRKLEFKCPPEAFGIVAPGIYRSSALHPSHFSFLKSLKLKTVVVLSPEAPSRTITHFLNDNQIKLLHLGHVPVLHHPTPWSLSEELIKDALELILDSALSPLLITCTSGAHETGVLVGCLRKLQGWSITSLIMEYRLFAGSKARFGHEQFMELFDLDLIAISRHVPIWLNDHETRNLR